MTTEKRSFANTRAALIEYDAMAAHRDHLFNTVESNADVAAWEQVCLDDLNDVREAFWHDTKDINSRDNCMRVELEFMRKCAKDSA